MMDEKRLEILDDGKGVDITISGKIERWKEGLLLGWVVLWTLCGVYIASQLFFSSLPREEKLILLVYIVFWAYFEYKSVHAFLWRKYGEERIRIADGELYYKKDIRGYGKATRFFIDNIKSLREITIEKNTYSSVYFRSFWVIGGERLEFSYQGKTIRFAMQLDDKEVKTLFNVIRRRLRKK